MTTDPSGRRHEPTEIDHKTHGTLVDGFTHLSGFAAIAAVLPALAA